MEKNKIILTLCSFATATACIMAPQKAEAHHHCWGAFGIGAAVGALTGCFFQPRVVVAAPMYPAYTTTYYQPTITVAQPAQQQLSLPKVEQPRQTFPGLKPGQTLTVKPDGSYVITQQPVVSSTNVVTTAKEYVNQ